jgi:hypothetical protein
MRPLHTVTAALRRFIGDYRRLHSPTYHQDRVLDWLCACQTSELGGRMAECESGCGWESPVYNSCTDRHCPQCRGEVRAKWLDARCDQLLPVPHFQVTSTLPGVLRDIARDNPKVVYGLQFRATSETLQQLAADDKRLGAQLGIIAVLHTWGSNLVFHPHVHCLVSAGGLRLDQEAWVATNKEYLFPTSVMAKLFRGKVIEGLHAAFSSGDLHIRGEPAHAEVAFKTAIRQAYLHRWVVDVEAPDGRPAERAAKYLARYVGGVAISDARMVEITPTHVTYKIRNGMMKVEGHEFVRRFSQHILPRRFNKVRYYGLYAPSNVHFRWARARQLLDAPLPPPRPERPARTCPVCGGPVLERSIPGLRWSRPRRPPRARGPP